MSTAEEHKALVAIDLGAESCRVSLLRWGGSGSGGEPHITLVHRFANSPVSSPGSGQDELHWSLQRIEAGVDEGLRRCAQLAPEGIRSIAVDGWAVDYVRLDHEGKPFGDPFCYRDLRTLPAEAWLHEQISAERMREITAISASRINTLYQQVADRMANLPASGGWLNLPEFLLFRLGGRPVSERTMAAHSQMMDATAKTWSEEIFKAAGLDHWAAPVLVDPGTDVGQVTGEFAELPAYAGTRLIAPACHDTASAIAGIPAIGEDWAYVSSGTWSLVGTLVPKPVNTPAAAADGFTNLAAAGGLTCFHVNVNGMWMLAQCMEQWKEVGKSFPDKAWTIEELVGAAEIVPAPAALLTVDDPDLLLPGRMMQRINAQLRAGGHAELDETPDAAPAFASLIFHSLAARYQQVLGRIEAHTGKKLARIFIVGGGSRNRFLNRLIEEATGMPVVCGSAESSTIGNFAVQLGTLEGKAGPDAGTIHRWAERLKTAYSAPT